MKLVLLLVLAMFVAAEPWEASPKDPEPEKAEHIDSRLVSTGEPCMADQVTVTKTHAWTAASGSTYEEAVDNCKKWLTWKVWLIADVECRKYSKIGTASPDDPGVELPAEGGPPQGTPCRAHRGNFDPTANVKINYKDHDKKTGKWTVGCEIKSQVKYTCN